jgi:small subunit ribosomal protein S14
MLNSKIKDLKYRKIFYKIEMKRIVNSFVFINLVSNPNLNLKLKKNIFFKFYKQKHKRVATRLVNRCILTNRGRGTLRSFKISRSLFRELLGFGIIPGYKKATW